MQEQATSGQRSTLLQLKKLSYTPFERTYVCHPTRVEKLPVKVLSNQNGIQAESIDMKDVIQLALIEKWRKIGQVCTLLFMIRTYV